MNTPSTSSSRIEDFSLLDPRVQSDPREFYSLLHEQRPVYLMPEMGMYVVARYEDARAMVQDHETFSSSSNLIGSKFDGSIFENYNKMLAEKGWARVDTLSWTDPPEHGRYRMIVDKVFNVRYVRELQPHIAQVANDLIDKFIAGPKQIRHVQTLGQRDCDAGCGSDEPRPASRNRGNRIGDAALSRRHLRGATGFSDR